MLLAYWVIGWVVQSEAMGADCAKFRRGHIPAAINAGAALSPIGIEAQYLEKIFGVFKWLHKDQYPGAAIGLAIAKNRSPLPGKNPG